MYMRANIFIDIEIKANVTKQDCVTFKNMIEENEETAVGT